VLDDPVADRLLVTSSVAAFEAMLLTEMVLNDIHMVLCYGTIRESDVSLWSGEVAFGSFWEAKSGSDFAPSFGKHSRVFSNSLGLADIHQHEEWMYHDTSTGRRYRLGGGVVFSNGWTRWVRFCSCTYP
jgi:hypothetical protein